VSNWKTIDDLRAIFIEKYTDSKLNNELEKACSEEFELMRDYNGRQILELLQNVDDAYGELKKLGNIHHNEGVEVQVTFKNQILEVGNTGTTFTKETIERLCLGRASNKSSQNIGNKGTGFRSLLNNAEWVELYSGEFAIRFSEAFSKSCFNQFRHNELLAKQLLSWKKEYHLCFPIMNCPEQIEPIETNFDTLIRIKLKDHSTQNENSISHQLEQPFYKSLLFLPNISKILITVDGVQRIAEKIGTSNDVIIQQTVNRIIEHKMHYFVANKVVQIGNKDAMLAIAVPKNKDYDFKKEKLYCYFPIREFPTPINALIHAPFMTNSSRDNISNDSEGVNKRIFKHVLHFIKEIAEQLAQPEYGDLALDFVIPKSEHRLWMGELFDLYDDYLQLLSEAKILPTINGEFLSIKENPKIVSNLPKEFKGRHFKALLNITAADHFELINELAAFIDYTEIEYTPEQLVDKINAIKVDWDLATIIKIFLWWSRHYANADFMPELLLDTRNNYIQKNYKVFLPTDGGVSYLPNELHWVKLCILQQSYVEELIHQIKANFLEEWRNINEKFTAGKAGDKRLLAAYSALYLAIEFTEQSSSDLIIGTINRQIDTVEKARSFINWFFEKYENKLQSGSELSKLSYNLPDVHGVIKPANKLFLGEHYGHQLGEKIFNNNTYTALMEPAKLYNGYDVEKFKNFIEKCGVLKYPLIVMGEPSKCKQFNDFLKQKYTKEIDFNINYIKVKKIDHFENVLNELTTSEIVEWVNLDENLLELLHSVRRESNVSQQSNWTGFNFNSNEYLIYLLNTTPWIQLDGHKFTPQQIVMYDKLKGHIPSLYGISTQELTEIVGDTLIKLLDFKESMGQLKDVEIKQILLQLPKLDKGEISRKLYTEIIKYKRDLLPTYSLDDIQVLANDGKFYLNKYVKYADRKLPKILEKENHFIYIPVKQSITTIKNWLSVERFNVQFKLNNCEKKENSIGNFIQEINDIKVAILSTIDLNKTNVDKIKRMHIIVCDEVIVKDIERNNQLISLEDYYFVEENRDFYLKSPNDIQTIEQLRLADGFASAIVEMFKQLLTLEIDINLVELLISKDTPRKRERVAEIYGIDRWNEAYELLFMENAITKIVVKYFSDLGASENIISKLNNIDFTYIKKDEEMDCIIKALMVIGKDIEDVNELSELIRIDIREYWFRKVKDYIEKTFEQYCNKLFSKLDGEGDEIKQNNYLDELYTYKEFYIALNDIPNKVSFNFIKEIEYRFPILIEDVVEQDVKVVYKSNYEMMNPENLFADEIAVNSKVQIMIYFKRTNKFKCWLKDMDQKLKQSEMNNGNDIYKKYKNVIPQKVDITYRNNHSTSTTAKKGKFNVFTKSGEEKINNAKKIAGNKGEQLIYNLLCEQYGKENVVPKSEAFVDLGILKPGQATSGQYDLSYKDKDGNQHFVEVKTSTNNFFILTPGELKFAKQHPNSFKLYLVTGLDSEIPTYMELPSRFWEQPSKFKLSEIVSKIEVEF
jgi:hypothetical protein